MNPRIKMTIKANELQARFFGCLGGTEYGAYLMTERKSFGTPTAFNDNGSTPETFTDVSFTQNIMTHKVEVFLDITCTASDDLGNEYLKIVDYVV